MGVGDLMGMAVTHAVASGMGGIRTAGDLVARMQIARSLKIDGAKRYVADKLNVSPTDLSDEMIMNDIREELNLGTVMSRGGQAKGMEAKFRIAELLDIKINSVEVFKKNAGWRG